MKFDQTATEPPARQHPAELQPNTQPDPGRFRARAASEAYHAIVAFPRASIHTLRTHDEHNDIVALSRLHWKLHRLGHEFLRGAKFWFDFLGVCKFWFEYNTYLPTIK